MTHEDLTARLARVEEYLRARAQLMIHDRDAAHLLVFADDVAEAQRQLR